MSLDPDKTPPERPSAKAAAIDPLFAFHQLNADGQVKAVRIAEIYTRALLELEALFPFGGREGALARTHLEQSCQYAKKAMATQTANQQPKE